MESWTIVAASTTVGTPIPITADSLGPHVVENLHITRHMIREYGLQSLGKEKMHRISGIIPGVMAQTGMETSEIIQGIVAETKPDIVIAIDALAARSTRRLNRTIQITDTGINPGSGVGNHRVGLTEENLQVKVIAELPRPTTRMDSSRSTKIIMRRKISVPLW